MNKTIETLGKIGIIPVAVIDDPKNADLLGKALCDGNIPCAEVTFRTSAAEESIKILAKDFPNMTIGAGTVLSTEQVDRAVGAGAKFIVSPGFNPKVVEHCLKIGVPVTPGVQTPTEIELATSYGLEILKFFPAEAAGGLKMLKALASVYSSVKFMPTGGINKDNLSEYLANPFIFACGGTWMVEKKLIQNGDFDKITELSLEASKIAKKFRA